MKHRVGRAGGVCMNGRGVWLVCRRHITPGYSHAISSGVKDSGHRGPGFETDGSQSRGPGGDAGSSLPVCTGWTSCLPLAASRGRGSPGRVWPGEDSTEATQLHPEQGEAVTCSRRQRWASSQIVPAANVDSSDLSTWKLEPLNQRAKVRPTWGVGGIAARGKALFPTEETRSVSGKGPGAIYSRRPEIGDRSLKRGKESRPMPNLGLNTSNPFYFCLHIFHNPMHICITPDNDTGVTSGNTLVA